MKVFNILKNIRSFSKKYSDANLQIAKNYTDTAVTGYAVGFPDYVNRQELINQTISADQVFTGTFANDGYVQIHASTDGNTWTPFWRFHINDVMVNEHSKSTTANYLYRWTELIPVKAGDTYRLQLAYSHFRFYFYPFRS